MINQSLEQRLSETRTGGIRVLLNLIPGHISIENERFTHSRKAESDPYTDYYVLCDLLVGFQTVW
ncbi:MAG: Oligo-1,6-glucosidase 1 [Chloroflexi bacterium ADurb.Bin120]|jgi:maltose alpha-D-glucosyltransferase/alpha-amylase|uniref:Glycosyl hydrolase family 13 catalytic domain-containing protein n=1 Tax=Candidatus Brevifilum fermentans TaxID=1986204 RepID=A0A1Y6K1H8_9CHLR|nr:alpha-amylase family glycosyl hydrolase [Brevefilum fermentans]MDI9565314.1 alpha-amylase family glycosyl hydrolase [Chloroflexota bacterium]OQB87317.1 MAG: Oligo-1,6-glucosidase 1 [Chloroflexi bacterium ADurb.Bin120]SMX53513.1 protein of unknown function [Brevefilum fermentans]